MKLIGLLILLYILSVTVGIVYGLIGLGIISGVLAMLAENVGGSDDEESL